MSRRILIDHILKSNPPFTAADAAAAVDCVFAALRRGLEEGERPVTIPGFGTFRRKFRETRQVRNPKTGERSTKIGHHVITFKEAKPAR